MEDATGNTVEGPQRFERGLLSPLLRNPSGLRRSHLPKSLSSGRIDIPPLFLAEEEAHSTLRRASMAPRGHGPWSQYYGVEPPYDPYRNSHISPYPPVPPIPKSYSMQNVSRSQVAPRAAAMRHPGPPITYNRQRTPYRPPTRDPLRSTPTVAHYNFAVSTSAGDLSQPPPKSSFSRFPPAARANISRTPSALEGRNRDTSFIKQPARYPSIPIETSQQRVSRVLTRNPIEAGKFLPDGPTPKSGEAQVDVSRFDDGEKKREIRKTSSFFRHLKTTLTTPEYTDGIYDATTPRQVRPQRSFFQLRKPSQTPTRIPTPIYNQNSQFLNGLETPSPPTITCQISSAFREPSPRQYRFPYNNNNDNDLLGDESPTTRVKSISYNPPKRSAENSVLATIQNQACTKDASIQNAPQILKTPTASGGSKIARNIGEGTSIRPPQNHTTALGASNNQIHTKYKTQYSKAAKLGLGNREAQTNSRTSPRVSSRRIVSTPVLPSQKKENIPPRTLRLLGPISPTRTQNQSQFPTSGSLGVLPVLQPSLSKPSLNLNNASAQDLFTPPSNVAFNASARSLKDFKPEHISSTSLGAMGVMVPKVGASRLDSTGITFVNGICKVNTAQPSGFWAGRFTGIRDKFYNETVKSCCKSKEIAEMYQDNEAAIPSAYPVPEAFADFFDKISEDEDRRSWTLGLQALEEEDMRRCKRVFRFLDVMCCTSKEARDSLWNFQLVYAMSKRCYELLPYGATIDDVYSRKQVQAENKTESEAEKKEQKQEKWMGKLKKALSKGESVMSDKMSDYA